MSTDAQTPVAGPDKPPVVAVINTSPDVIAMLRIAFERAGLVTVSCFTFDIREGRVDPDAFMQQHDPRVIVYDVAPPYAANWQLFQQSIDARSGLRRHNHQRGARSVTRRPRPSGL